MTHSLSTFFESAADVARSVSTRAFATAENNVIATATLHDEVTIDDGARSGMSVNGPHWFFNDSASITALIEKLTQLREQTEQVEGQVALRLADSNTEAFK